jgi:hypothetical protein
MFMEICIKIAPNDISKHKQVLMFYLVHPCAGNVPVHPTPKLI